MRTSGYVFRDITNEFDVQYVEDRDFLCFSRNGYQVDDYKKEPGVFIGVDEWGQIISIEIYMPRN